MRSFTIPCLMAAALVAMQAVPVQADWIVLDWTAYNDFAGDLATGNVTNISGEWGDDENAPRPGATVPSGELVKYADGTSTGATLTIGKGGSLGLDRWGYSGINTTPTGGDAFDYFPAGTVGTGFAMNGTVGQYGILTITGLDPSARYDVTLFANRTGASDRINYFTISDVDTFVNSSSVGTTIDTYSMANDTTSFDAGANSATGRVARYTGISTGSAGDLVITVKANNYVHLAAMRIDAWVVPEPSTIALLSTGLLGLLCCGWRRRRY